MAKGIYTNSLIGANRLISKNIKFPDWGSYLNFNQDCFESPLNTRLVSLTTLLSYHLIVYNPWDIFNTVYRNSVDILNLIKELYSLR